MNFDDHGIDELLESLGVEIKISGITARCIFDAHEDLVEQPAGVAPQVKSFVAATVRTSAFPDVRANDQAEVGGEFYQIWTVLRQGNGTTQLTLRRG